MPWGGKVGQGVGTLLSSADEKRERHGGDYFLGMETYYPDPESQPVAQLTA